MELTFKRDTAIRKQYFTPESFAHPAKMDCQLLMWIVEQYTTVGETILDPMFGMGTTMLGCTLGRNVIGVELEQKFIDMARANWEKVKMMPQLGHTMGDCQIIQGDARQLDGLLVDKIVTSPPYAEQSDFRPEGGLKDTSQYHGGGTLPQKFGGADNIGNLPYGSIDSVITSPPYSEGLGHQHRQYGRDIEASKSIQAPEYSRSPENIGNKPYGNIDHIITSPPYEGTNTTGRANTYNGSHGPHSQVQIPDYRESKANIGNLKSDSYLAAMLQVYQQCRNVLKAQGLIILVTKNFIRNRQIVRLDTDTIKLCEQAGFTFIERHRRKLPAQSFWRTIYYQKYPDVEKLEHEDILVFKAGG